MILGEHICKYYTKMTWHNTNSLSALISRNTFQAFSRAWLHLPNRSHIGNMFNSHSGSMWLQSRLSNINPGEVFYGFPQHLISISKQNTATSWHMPEILIHKYSTISHQTKHNLKVWNIVKQPQRQKWQCKTIDIYETAKLLGRLFWVVVDWCLIALQHLWSLAPQPFISQIKLSLLGITRVTISD